MAESFTELLAHRAAQASDHHHSRFYRNAAEAWLESLLLSRHTALIPA